MAASKTLVGSLKPTPLESRDKVKVWRPANLLALELHRGTSVTRECPPHWHEEFHFCAIENGKGELRYRGAAHNTPAGCLFIVHPGEVHSNEAFDEAGCSYRNFYIDPHFLRQTAEEFNQTHGVPFFPGPVLFDRFVLNSYLQLHQSLEYSPGGLEQESLLLGLLAYLIRNYSETRPNLRPAGTEKRAVQRVRDFLIDHHAENVSLAQLSRIANLSPFHLNRVFSSALGLPPHAFQTQVRVLKAKDLLNKGWKPSDVASATGFADQSHLTRHFKRLVGVPPAEYQKQLEHLPGFD